MDEKEKICDTIKKIYEDWAKSRHDAYVQPDNFFEWKKQAEAERDELLERIRKL